VEGIEIRPARYADRDVQKLVAEALADLAGRYGGSGDDAPVSPADFEPPAGAFFVAYAGDAPVGCGGWRSHGPDAELKRMYTAPAVRGRGVARRVLAAVEDSARRHGRRRLILECGSRQPEAIALYTASGYHRIADFGYYKDYAGVLSFARDL
jgi:GNAT superfamily N-acetyltransferase